jgi:hypothetical protein
MAAPFAASDTCQIYQDNRGTVWARTHLLSGKPASREVYVLGNA